MTTRIAAGSPCPSCQSTRTFQAAAAPDALTCDACGNWWRPLRRCADADGFCPHCVPDLDTPAICTKCRVPMPGTLGARAARARLAGFEAEQVIPARCRFDCPEPCDVHRVKKDRTLDGLGARVQFLETSISKLFLAVEALHTAVELLRPPEAGPTAPLPEGADGQIRWLANVFAQLSKRLDMAGEGTAAALSVMHSRISALENSAPPATATPDDRLRLLEAIPDEDLDAYQGLDGQNTAGTVTVTEAIGALLDAELRRRERVKGSRRTDAAR